MSGHFVWLPEEKGYTADLLRCNQTSDSALNFSRIPPRAAAGCGWELERGRCAREKKYKWEVAGKPVQKLRKHAPSNNQRPKSICSTPKRSGRTTEECAEWAEWAFARQASESVSPTNTQQPVCLSPERRWPGGTGPSRGTNSNTLLLVSLPFFFFGIDVAMHV